MVCFFLECWSVSAGAEVKPESGFYQALLMSPEHAGWWKALPPWTHEGALTGDDNCILHIFLAAHLIKLPHCTDKVAWHPCCTTHICGSFINPVHILNIYTGQSRTNMHFAKIGNWGLATLHNAILIEGESHFICQKINFDVVREVDYFKDGKFSVNLFSCRSPVAHYNWILRKHWLSKHAGYSTCFWLAFRSSET